MAIGQLLSHRLAALQERLGHLAEEGMHLSKRERRQATRAGK